MPWLLRQNFSGMQTQGPIRAVLHSRIFAKDSVAPGVFHNLWEKIGNWWKRFWYFSCRAFARWFFWEGCICSILWKGKPLGRGEPLGKASACCPHQQGRAVFAAAAGLCLPLALAVPGFSHPSLKETSVAKEIHDECSSWFTFSSVSPYWPGQPVSHHPSSWLLYIGECRELEVANFCTRDVWKRKPIPHLAKMMMPGLNKIALLTFLRKSRHLRGLTPFIA